MMANSAAAAAAAASAAGVEGGSGGGDKKQKEGKQKKQPNPNVVVPPKKPKLSKAERRALQEAQRAAKAAGGQGKKGSGAGGGGKGGGAAAAAGAEGKKGGKGGGVHVGGGGGKTSKGGGASSSGGAGGGGQREGSGEARDPAMEKTLSLFSHLPQYRDPRQFEQEFSGVTLGSSSSPSDHQHLHPAVLTLGLQYASGTVRGGNARAKAMLRAFQEVIRDYEPPTFSSSAGGDSRDKKNDLRYDLDHRIIKPAFQYWTTKCRPHSVSMGNAFTFLKLAVASLDRDISAEEARDVLIDTIDAYVQERIDVADRAISKHASKKIVDGDVILTYACSDVVEVLLTDVARDPSKTFRVIVVDSRPLLEGRDLVQRLASAGIECTYILLNALSYVMMREVTKVFLGAAALMSDGSVLSRVGTACVALLARSNNVPVLVCCETYKISNRVQLESITGNELGNPDDVAATGDGAEGGGSSLLDDWRTVPNLKLLNLLYDLTPSEFVSGIVTEMGILPPTSVAVLLREMNPQDNTAFMSDL